MKKAQILGLSALLLAIVFDLLFFRKEISTLGLNIVLAQLCFLGVTYSLAVVYKHTLPVRAHIAALFGLLLTLPFVLWTSEYAWSVAFAGFFISNLLFAAFAMGDDASFRQPLDVLWTGTTRLVTRLFHNINFFPKMRPEKMSKRSWSVLKGLAILVPLFFIFLSLFASADAVFASYLTDIQTWLEKWLEFDLWFEHALFITVLTFAFTLFFAGTFFNRYPHQARSDIEHRGGTEAIVVLGGTVLLFAVFLVIQGVTMFGGEAALRSLNLTYSEYARSGFDQLIWVSVLVAALILTIRHFITHKVSNVFIVLQAALVGETMLVLVSAFMRMSLYVQTYGYTPARLFAYWVMLTLGILLLLLLANIIQRESQVVLMRRALVVLGICAVIFSYSTPDALSAKLNVDRAARGGKEISAYSMHSLTDEAAFIIDYAYHSDVPVSQIIDKSVPAVDERYCTLKNQGDLNNDFSTRLSIQNWYTALKPYDAQSDEFYAHVPGYRPKHKWQEWNMTTHRVHAANLTAPAWAQVNTRILTTCR